MLWVDNKEKCTSLSILNISVMRKRSRDELPTINLDQRITDSGSKPA